MTMLDRPGCRLHYTDDGTGPPILLTHGFSATSRMWEGQVRALALGHRMIRWDMRGHGDSDAPVEPGAYSHAASVADMAAVLDACGVARAVLVGLSLGGYLSLRFHLAHPARVRALVLLDTGPGYRSDTARAAWNVYSEERARAIETRGAAGLIESDEIRAEWHRTLSGLPHVARGMLTQADADVIDHLPAIDVPTLLIVGADDTPFLAGMAYMARTIPGARYEIVPNAGHAVNIAQPDRVNALLAEFLAALPE